MQYGDTPTNRDMLVSLMRNIHRIELARLTGIAEEKNQLAQLTAHLYTLARRMGLAEWVDSILYDEMTNWADV